MCVYTHTHIYGLPGGLDGKDSAGSARDLGLIPGLGRSPGEGHGNPLQCSCLENPMDRGAWQVTVHGVTKSRTWLRALCLCIYKYILCCIYTVDKLASHIMPCGYFSPLK